MNKKGMLILVLVDFRYSKMSACDSTSKISMNSCYWVFVCTVK